MVHPKYAPMLVTNATDEVEELETLVDVNGNLDVTGTCNNWRQH